MEAEKGVVDLCIHIRDAKIINILSRSIGYEILYTLAVSHARRVHRYLGIDLLPECVSQS